MQNGKDRNPKDREAERYNEEWRRKEVPPDDKTTDRRLYPCLLFYIIIVTTQLPKTPHLSQRLEFRK